nr:kinesin-like protein KIF28P [Crassostrea gigas]
MMERGANKGLLPRMTEEIFQTVNDNNDPNLEYQVLFSMMEIYNEQVFDLFEDVPKNAKRTMLKIYENKASNLLCVPVSNQDEVASFLIKGYQNRTIASTNMNEYSSRAHTIATIYVKQIQSNAKATLSSQISIVDLAGSERAAKTKAIGVRLKQGANINLSLMHLGTVIRTLAKKPGHQNQKPMHRNSKLTMLLKDSLGGNSKTVMASTK